MLGRNDPKLGADRPRSWGGSTAFGADVGRIDPGRIDRYPENNGRGLNVNVQDFKLKLFLI